jgi:hypothetical protein
MNLSSEACLLLNEPMKYLDLNHGQKDVVDSTHIWTLKHRKNYLATGVLSKEVFVKALMSIRKYASQRGAVGEEKDLIHTSILKYSKMVCHKFKSVNQLNYHLKGLYGCELPKKFRDQMYNIMEGGEASSSEEPVLLSPQEPTDTSTKEVNIGGLMFTLTKGSSLTIGELSTESLNLQGMKSIKIDRVSEGRLFGVSLEV